MKQKVAIVTTDKPMAAVATMANPEKKFNCRGCGANFAYARRKPKYCPDCRRLARSADVLRWRKQFRKGAKEENYQGKSAYLTPLEGQTYGAVAAALGVDEKTVRFLERQTLAKIRANPELRTLWDHCRDELGEGGQILPGGYVVGAAAKGEFLLRHQAVLGRWYRLQERLVGAELYHEAAEVGEEIERYRQGFGELIGRL